MKILIDLGHPAHIHYFKNFIWQMEDRGHVFCLVARDKEVLQILLKEYNFNFINRGKGGNRIIGKLLYIMKADYIIWKTAKNFKPDIFLSFASTYAAHAAKLYGKPHIVFDDTEHAKFELMLYTPFSDVILNPQSFWKHYSKKQIFFDGFMELSYLHPKYFTPDKYVLHQYGLSIDEPFFIVRFVSWTASHDIGQSGLSYGIKKEIISKLSAKGRVLISSEGKLPDEFEKYRIRINPVHLHHFLSYASLYVGEGATTASECVILGTPSIYINSLDAGTISEQSLNYGLISLRNSEGILDHISRSILVHAKELAIKNRDQLLQDKIDVTSFMVWFVDNYPDSARLLLQSPNYQYKFK